MMTESSLKWIYVDPEKFQENEKSILRTGEKWVELYDEYLEHFGISKHYQKIINIEDKISKLIVSRWLKEDKSLENIIKIETMKLQELNGKKKNTSTFEEDVAILEKYRGIGMDIKKTSVKMFYTYVKLMEKDGEKN
jgi:hypothetical protein